MKCTQVNLLPVVNKQNQAEFMQKNKTVSTQCELRTKHSVEHYTTQVSQAARQRASKQANKPSHLYIYRMHSTINIIQIEWGSQWTLQFCWQIDILSSLHECLSVFCGWLYRFSHIHLMVCCFYSPINKCACNNTHSTQYTHTYFVSAAKFMDLSVGKYRTTLMVHTQQIYTTC